MTISAHIEKDSIGPSGVRATTFVLRYPRFIHSELMTHRDFSRNASSSRAIPFKKQVEMMREDPAMPLSFKANQKGMQAGEELPNQEYGKVVWLRAMEDAISWATILDTWGAHKQYVNRVLEPFTHITVVFTGTRFSNFFALRHHTQAQPEIAELARQMWELYQKNEPHYLAMGEMHLPFVSPQEIWELVGASPMPSPGPMAIGSYDQHIQYWLPLIKKSVARCARVSYLNHDKTQPSEQQDFELHDRLLISQPIHASPAEHQVLAISDDKTCSGNVHGWIQYRKTLPGEYITEFTEPLG